MFGGCVQVMIFFTKDVMKSKLPERTGARCGRAVTRFT